MRNFRVQLCAPCMFRITDDEESDAYTNNLDLANTICKLLNTNLKPEVLTPDKKSG